MPVGREASADLELLKAAVTEAGDIARSFYGKKPKVWDKKGTPVSEADLAVDKRLREVLLAARPDYGWLSEETEDDPVRRTKRRVFILDPIDGTVSFIKHKPEWVVALCVVEDTRPVVAAIFNPITGEMFEAVAGGGAKLNGEAIAVTRRGDVEGSRMLGSKSMFKHPAWQQPWPEMHVETRGSIAYRMALVANGEFDAMMALSGKGDWDLAAADLIVGEAGGVTRTHRGDVLHYNRESTLHPSVMCAGPELYEELFKRVGHLNLPTQRV